MHLVFDFQVTVRPGPKLRVIEVDDGLTGICIMDVKDVGSQK